MSNIIQTIKRQILELEGEARRTGCAQTLVIRNHESQIMENGKVVGMVSFETLVVTVSPKSNLILSDTASLASA